MVDIWENINTECFVFVFFSSHLSAQYNKTEDISNHAYTRHNHSGHPGDPETHVLKQIDVKFESSCTVDSD